MADTTDATVKRVFALLDRWRHLPAYQLERRADVLFALFLPDVLQGHFGVPINPKLIPEFPIKNQDDNQSSKVDFLALQDSPDGKRAERAFLVELKTDMASRREEQDKTLRYAERRGMKKLIIDVLEICTATNQKPKYVHLLSLLSEVGLLDYKEALWPVRQGYSALLKEMTEEVKRPRHWPSLEVVYVQPRVPEIPKVIDFEQFADAIERSGRVGLVFADHLRKWASLDAGCPEPRGLP